MSKPSMADVAKLAGVSKNTVSLALRGSLRISEKTRKRVAEVAGSLGYTANSTVSNLMAQLRQSRAPGYQSTLAIMNANEDRDAFTRHQTVPLYVQGCKRRARQLGYQLDEFWMHDPEMPISRWLSIFRARNIRGIVIVGLMNNNRLPSHLAPLWDEFPVVVTGVRTRDPALTFACSDHHSLALEAMENAVSLGYERPALVIDKVIDELTEGRFTAGFLTGQSRLVSVGNRIHPFYEVGAARNDLSIFKKWLGENRPDVIFTLYHEVKRWLDQLGLTAPRDLGLIQYEWRQDHGNWAGMDQRNDLVGEAAIDMIISRVQNNERGVPEQPRATMIASRWVNGVTVIGPISLTGDIRG
jgi:LacI family transcriptional regulator